MEALYRAIRTSDIVSGKSRGFVVVTPVMAPPGPEGRAKARSPLAILGAMLVAAFALGFGAQREILEHGEIEVACPIRPQAVPAKVSERVLRRGRERRAIDPCAGAWIGQRRIPDQIRTHVHATLSDVGNVAVDV